VRGTDLYVEGHPFTVKGIHYGPWRPGTGPNKGYPYPTTEQVEADFKLILSLNANTILVADAPDYVLDLAAKYNLRVLYSMFVQWWTIGADDSKVPGEILPRVEALKHKRALLGWVLGNEIPPLVIQTRGGGVIEAGLQGLYQQVKAADPSHPITHSNWPVTRDLNLQFLDIVSFNVYPLWPPEVVAQGYENYVRDVLKSLAGSKPLLISEFGVNSLEAGEDGQSRLLKQSWVGLRNAGACGGVVFEFADEWWKNYDNPRRPGAYWDRQTAADDEKTHDQDPEEYYGVAQADRQPKPAFTVVQAMFAEDDHKMVTTGRLIPALLISLLLLLAGGTWLLAVRKVRSEPSNVTPDLSPRHRTEL